MKKIVALSARRRADRGRINFPGTLAVQSARSSSSIPLSSTSIQEQLSDCSELATAGPPRPRALAENGDIDFSSRRRPSPLGLRMPSCAQEAGSGAGPRRGQRQRHHGEPAGTPHSGNRDRGPDSLEFHDSSFCAVQLGRTDKDTAEALKVAQQSMPRGQGEPGQHSGG